MCCPRMHTCLSIHGVHKESNSMYTRFNAHWTVCRFWKYRITDSVELGDPIRLIIGLEVLRALSIRERFRAAS